jgi:hypothetical protein
MKTHLKASFKRFIYLFVFFLTSHLTAGELSQNEVNESNNQDFTNFPHEIFSDIGKYLNHHTYSSLRLSQKLFSNSEIKKNLTMQSPLTNRYVSKIPTEITSDDVLEHTPNFRNKILTLAQVYVELKLIGLMNDEIFLRLHPARPSTQQAVHNIPRFSLRPRRSIVNSSSHGSNLANRVENQTVDNQLVLFGQNFAAILRNARYGACYPGFIKIIAIGLPFAPVTEANLTERQLNGSIESFLSSARESVKNYMNEVLKNEEVTLKNNRVYLKKLTISAGIRIRSNTSPLRQSYEETIHHIAEWMMNRVTEPELIQNEWPEIIERLIINTEYFLENRTETMNQNPDLEFLFAILQRQNDE